LHRRNTLLALLTLACLTLLFPRPAAAQAPADDALIAQIDALAAKALQKPGAAGLSIAVARGDTFILNKGYGKADLENNVPATQDSLFRIGSVTKQYTAAAIMKLAEQGKLSLDDDFTKYVDFPTQGHSVTIRQLLNHTSGIKSYTDTPGFFETGSALDLTPTQVLDTVRTLPFDFEPGSKWAYNNTGYHLLGMVIEKVAAAAYADYLDAEFFTPLNLKQTRYDSNSDIIPNRARGYSFKNGKAANAAHLGMTIPFSAGGLMATAHDLVAWQVALAAGKAVSLDSYTQMTTPTKLPDGSDTKYGFGLFMDEFEGHPRVQHGGGINGFNSMLAYYPKESVSVAVISSSETVPSARLAQEIAGAVLGIKAPEVKDLALPADVLDSCTGNYHIADIGLDLAVTTAIGKLIIQATDQPAVPVMAQGDREFRASFDTSVRLVFDAPVPPDAKCPSFTLHQGGFTFKALRVP